MLFTAAIIIIVGSMATATAALHGVDNYMRCFTFASITQIIMKHMIVISILFIELHNTQIIMSWIEHTGNYDA